MSAATRSAPSQKTPEGGHAPGGKQSRRTRSRSVNLPLLLASGAVVVCGAVAAWLLYGFQSAKLSQAMKARGEQLMADKDWRGATSYLQRYLWTSPGDVDARLKFVDAVRQGVETPGDRRRLSSTLFETIGIAPDRVELRVQLAENLLELGDLFSAKAEAEKYLDLDASKIDQDDAAKARRVIALVLSGLARDAGQAAAGDSANAKGQAVVTIPEAADALRASLAEFPDDIRLATVSADFYRRNAATLDARGDADDPQRSSAAEQADEFMDRMVANRPNDPDAYTARFAYHQRHGLPDVDRDVQAALKLDPKHYEALLLAAGPASADDAATARDLLRQAIAVAPKDVRAHMALAQLEYRSGRVDAALAAAQEGLRAVGPGNLAIDFLIANLLVEAKRLPEAKQSLATLEATIQRSLSEMTAVGRQSVQSQFELLRARLAIAGGELRVAAEALKAVAAGADEGQRGASSAERLQAKALLAAVMGQLGYKDVAATNWGELAALLPMDGEVCRQAAAANLELGQHDLAIELFERYLHPPVLPSGQPAWSPAPEANLQLLQAHLNKQLGRPTGERNWSEFDGQIEEVRRLFPDKLEPLVAQIDRWQSAGTKAGAEKAEELLAQGEKLFAADPRFWRVSTLARQRMGQEEQAERALAEFDKLEPSLEQRAVLRSMYLMRRNDMDGADQSLQKLLVNVNPQQRRVLQLLRFRLLLGFGAADRAQEVVNDLIKNWPTDPEAIGAGIELALQAKDYKQAESLQRKLESLSATDDFSWRFYRARAYLDRYESLSPQDRAELGRVVADLRSMRPTWNQAVALSARYADLQGNRQQAIEAYQLAVSLGGATPQTVERLATLLYADGRYADAEKYLSQMSGDASSSPALESLAISTALRLNQVKEAIALAAQTMERHPDDPTRVMAYANLLAVDGQREEAETTLREALKRFPKDVRIWQGLFSLLVRSNQAAEAKQLLGEVPALLGENSFEKCLVAGHASELLGDAQRARNEYEQAVKLRPADANVRMQLAKMLMSTDVPKATEQFTEVVKLDKNNREARRQLAMLWAASGKDEDWQKATQLLQDSPQQGGAEALADSRVRAVLLARRGRNRKERQEGLTAARKILEEQVRTAGTAAQDVDRLLLAKACEQEALLTNSPSLMQAAREQFKFLSDRTDAPINYVVEYCDFLLRQVLQSPEFDATKSAAERESIAKEWASVKNVVVDDAKRRIVELEQDVQRRRAMAEALTLAGCRARLQQAVGDQEAAAQALTRFIDEKEAAIEKELGAARTYMAIGNLYAAIKQHEKAQHWYRRLADVASDGYLLLVRDLATQGKTSEAIKASLDAQTDDKSSPGAAAVLAQLLSMGPVDDAIQQQAEAVISAALEAHGDNQELLQAVAVLNVTRNKDDEAIQYFRRIIELAPKNSLALNNLATLLAERPDRREEALEFVNRAIEISGRLPALLDTLGTVQLRSGDYRQAVATLEEAVAGHGNDARYYFHLAAAYQGAGDLKQARIALDQARRLGLDDAILTQGDQELLQELEKSLGSSGDRVKAQSNSSQRNSGVRRALATPQLPQAA